MENWTGIKISSGPSVEPVSVAEVKTTARISDSSFDDMLGIYITACRKAIEGHIGKSLITQTLELYLDDFPTGNNSIELIYGPVQSISSITYTDTSGNAQTWDASKYRTDLVSLYPRIEPAYDEVYPDVREQINNVKITYVAGYGDAATDVPKAARVVIESLCCDLFEHPETNLETRLTENKTYKFLLNSITTPSIR